MFLENHLGRCIALRVSDEFAAIQRPVEPIASDAVLLEKLAGVDVMGVWIERPRWFWRAEGDPPDGYPLTVLVPWNAILSLAVFESEAPVDWTDGGPQSRPIGFSGDAERPVGPT